MNAFIQTYNYNILIYTKLQQLTERTLQSVDTGTDYVQAVFLI